MGSVVQVHNCMKIDLIFSQFKNLLYSQKSYGIITMESLYDEKVRKDSSFEKDYLDGKYDGLPDLEIGKELRLFSNGE